ncbi:YJL131C [Saccharomyces arboricola H-6]|uniref:Altered inheritance of mitochondria protein 23, mitochondrial n=1 Tax=Saccharomyces arboricola (strain H-6 / AS 2.3317 / CBS 10644) TaxID=1160507 RepID=J8Q3H5_SACAR|nr:YJL131C [Saccharomyces arboricola H-6]
MLEVLLRKEVLQRSLSLVNFRCFHYTKYFHGENASSTTDIFRNAMKRKRELASLREQSHSDGTKNIAFPKEFIKRQKQPSRNASKKKRILITWSTGTARAKEAANSVVSEIFQKNYKGNIKIVDPITHRIESSNIRYFAKGIDLDKVGLSIANVEQIDDQNQIPLVKIVESRVALKKYSDFLAKKKEKELMELGVMNKSFKTLEADKKEDNLKHIKISWQIENDDLQRQKAHEIVSLLKKGSKVTLYLDDKNNINSNNWLEGFEELDHLQEGGTTRVSKSILQKRAAVLETLKEIVSEYANEPVLLGNIGMKMIMKLTPRDVKPQDNDKRALKELRKKERQEKLQKRIEKKKLKEI